EGLLPPSALGVVQGGAVRPRVVLRGGQQGGALDVGGRGVDGGGGGVGHGNGRGVRWTGRADPSESTTRTPTFGSALSGRSFARPPRSPSRMRRLLPAFTLLLAALTAAPARAQSEGLLQVEDDLHHFLERQQVLGRLPGAALGAKPLSAYEAHA